MNKTKLLEALWAVAAAPPRLAVSNYSPGGYFKVCHGLTTAKQHAQRMLLVVSERTSITAEDIIASAPPRLVFDESLEMWLYSPRVDPVDYRAAVCETLAAALAKHYTSTGRSLGYHGAPWQEFGINIARAWFDYDRLKNAKRETEE
jgi:hypothetical protein